MQARRLIQMFSPGSPVTVLESQCAVLWWDVAQPQHKRYTLLTPLRGQVRMVHAFSMSQRHKIPCVSSVCQGMGCHKHM
jgi:hypothetical protein